MPTPSALLGQALRRRPILDADVRRVTPDGFPTEAQQDHELFQYDWAGRVADSLDKRIGTVEQTLETANGVLTARLSDEETTRLSETTALAQRASATEAEIADARGGQPSVSARFQEITTAYAAADLALGDRLDEVMVALGGNSAGARVRFTAIAAPAGVAARYAMEVETTTAGVFASSGIYIDVVGGIGRITFQADQLFATDPNLNGGTPGNIFQYLSGAFEFGVPFRVRGQDIAPSAITKVGFNVQDVSATNSIRVTFTNDKPTSEILVLVAINHAQAAGANYASTTFQVDGSGGSTLNATMGARAYALQINGSVQDTVYVQDTVAQVILAITGTGSIRPAASFVSAGPNTATLMFRIVNLPVGTHDFDVVNPLPAGSMRMAMAVMQLRDR